MKPWRKPLKTPYNSELITNLDFKIIKTIKTYNNITKSISMPHWIRSRVFVTVLLAILFVNNTLLAQDECLSVDQTGMVQKAFDSFQKDLFAYYNFENDSLKTYRTFLSEVASLSIDLRSLPSSQSIQITRAFKKLANNRTSIWIKLAEYETQQGSTAHSGGADGEEILIFNYRGGFIQCLKNTSDSEKFQDIISTLEVDANVSTSLVAQKLNLIGDAEFDSDQIKRFIAFDIYFSILMVVEKAFG